MANALFEFCGQKSANGIPSIDKAPYYYVFSKDFLNRNERLVSLHDIEYGFIDSVRGYNLIILILGKSTIINTSLLFVLLNSIVSLPGYWFLTFLIL